MKKTTSAYCAVHLSAVLSLGAAIGLCPLDALAQDATSAVEAADVRFGVDESARASVAAEVVAAILEGRGQDTDWSTLEDALGVPADEGADDPLRRIREDALRADRDQERVASGAAAVAAGGGFWRPSTREEMATAVVLLFATLSALVGAVVLVLRGASARRSVRARRPQGAEPVGLLSRLKLTLQGPGAGPVLAHDAALLLARLGKGPAVELVESRRSADRGDAFGSPSLAVPSTSLALHEAAEQSGSSFRPGRGFRLHGSADGDPRMWNEGPITLLANALRDRTARVLDGMLVALWLRKTPESGAE